MPSKILKSIALASVLMAGLSQMTSAQGLYWESMQRTGIAKESSPTKSYAMPKMFKVVSEGRESMIVRLDQEKFIVVNDKEKTYAEMTFAEMESKMKQAGSAMAGMNEEMKAKLAEMPAEQREMVEKMMKDRMGATGGGDDEVKYSVEKGSEKKTLVGMSASKYEVKHDDKVDATFWTTSELSGFEDIREGFKSFEERLGAMSPGKGKAMAKWWSQIEGFPLEVHTEFFDQVVTKVVKESTPESAFEIPKGYKKTDMMQMRGRGHRPPNDGGSSDN